MMGKKANPKKKPYVVKRNFSYEGKWLNFEKITYEDSRGLIRIWESAQRTSSGGAALIIATLSSSKKLVLVRQFRPPIDNYIIEFPAGLIDDGEDCKTTALRELKEETGYEGKIAKTTNPVYNSPGLTDEIVSIVFVDIDQNNPVNITPKACNEGTEDIEVFLVEEDKINEFLSEREKVGDKIDSKLMTYALAHI